MVIWGDDGLARLAPSRTGRRARRGRHRRTAVRRDEHGAAIAALHRDPHSPVEVLVATHLDEQAVRAAGVHRAAAPALTYVDDRVRVTEVPPARGFDTSGRPVIRMFN
ncbi:hypothetical protein ACFYSJ_08225 [Streptomyces sp. NPDC005248]|uniref:hypothetical protein n=1 Tax=Streptomyces sp. NPDC005248 TaxID=3364709 RepID=UPI00369D33AB